MSQYNRQQHIQQNIIKGQTGEHIKKQNVQNRINPFQHPIIWNRLRSNSNIITYNNNVFLKPNASIHTHFV